MDTGFSPVTLTPQTGWGNKGTVQWDQKTVYSVGETANPPGASSGASTTEQCLSTWNISLAQNMLDCWRQAFKLY